MTRKLAAGLVFSLLLQTGCLELKVPQVVALPTPVDKPIESPPPTNTYPPLPVPPPQPVYNVIPERGDLWVVTCENCKATRNLEVLNKPDCCGSYAPGTRDPWAIEIYRLDFGNCRTRGCKRDLVRNIEVRLNPANTQVRPAAQPKRPWEVPSL